MRDGPCVRCRAIADRSLWATIASHECVDVNYYTIVPNVGTCTTYTAKCSNHQLIIEWGRFFLNTRMNKRGDINIARVHVVPRAMSPIQKDTERATGCICQLMSAMPTGTLIYPIINWRACQKASSTAWPAWSKCRLAPACGLVWESEWELLRQTCIYHQRRPFGVV